MICKKFLYNMLSLFHKMSDYHQKEFPKVSIGIVSYGHEKYIKDCLESLKIQNYPNLEVFISDDCSKDMTRAKIDEFKRDNPDFPLHIVHPESNLGVTHNFNRVMGYLDGKYVAVFAGDDIMLPSRLLKQVKALEANPQASFCYTNVEWFNDKDNKKMWNHFGLFQKPPQGLRDIIKDFSIPTPSLLVRQSAMPQPAYHSGLKYISDFYNIVELMLKGDAVYVPEVLTRYRKHCESITQQNFFVEDREKVLMLLREKLPRGYEKELRAYEKLVFYARAMQYFNNKETLKGISYAFKTFPQCCMSVKWFLRCGLMGLSLLKSLQKGK